jgi:hypothetical protein
MTVQEVRRQRMLPLQTYDFEARATPAASTTYQPTRSEPVGWGEVALLSVPQLLLGVAVLSGAFIVKMMGG